MSFRGHSRWSIFFEGRLSHLEDALEFLQIGVQDSLPDIRDSSYPIGGGTLQVGWVSPVGCYQDYKSFLQK